MITACAMACVSKTGLHMGVRPAYDAFVSLFTLMVVYLLGNGCIFPIAGHPGWSLNLGFAVCPMMVPVQVLPVIVAGGWLSGCTNEFVSMMTRELLYWPPVHGV